MIVSWETLDCENHSRSLYPFIHPHTLRHTRTNATTLPFALTDVIKRQRLLGPTASGWYLHDIATIWWSEKPMCYWLWASESEWESERMCVRVRECASNFKRVCKIWKDFDWYVCASEFQISRLPEVSKLNDQVSCIATLLPLLPLPPLPFWPLLPPSLSVTSFKN